MLRSWGISISSKFTQVEGRVLVAPKLKAGNDEFFAQNGRWNFTNKRLEDPKKMGCWFVVNFSERREARFLSEDLRRCGAMKGIIMNPPDCPFEEKPEYRRAPPSVRVEEMIKEVRSRIKTPDDRPFILCILAESKNSLLYGPWKRQMLSVRGSVSQCIAPRPPRKVDAPSVAP